jgi:hypothetical protein
VFAGGEFALEPHSVETEVLVNVFSVDFSVVAKLQRNLLFKPINEEIRELVFVNFTVCLLLVFGHIFSKRRSN